MFKTFKNALKVKEIRQKLLYTFIMMIIVRLGCQLPIPGTSKSAIQSVMGSLATSEAYSFFSAFTGGSLEQMSVFALSITPYITSSIIMQLLTIAIPKLEELQNEGESGRKKIAEYTRYVTVALAVIESIAMAIGFGNQGVFGNVKAMSGMRYFFTMFTVVVTMTAGSAVLMWIGERITEKGVGNGISVILMINIIARIPSDLYALYQTKVKITETNGRSLGGAALAAFIIVFVIVAMIAFVVALQAAQRKIPVQYAKKVQGRQMVGGNSSHIPLKVNTAGVIPVIFASTLLSVPLTIVNFTSLDTTWWEMIFSYEKPIGFAIYIILIFLFSFFYSFLQISPEKMAENLKKQNAYIPGVKPGEDTAAYISKVLFKVTLLGATYLAIIASIPMIVTLVFNITSSDVSVLGTSIMIVVGVAIETAKQIKTQVQSQEYHGFM